MIDCFEAVIDPVCKLITFRFFYSWIFMNLDIFTFVLYMLYQNIFCRLAIFFIFLCLVYSIFLLVYIAHKIYHPRSWILTLFQLSLPVKPPPWTFSPCYLLASFIILGFRLLFDFFYVCLFDIINQLINCCLFLFQESSYASILSFAFIMVSQFFKYIM